ncbi:unnamed protein product [Pylaiella littoralis]
MVAPPAFRVAAAVVAAIATGLVTTASAFAVAPRAIAPPWDGAKPAGISLGACDSPGTSSISGSSLAGRPQQHRQQHQRWLPVVCQQRQGRGSCVDMMMSEAPPPGKGKFIKLGGTGDTQSFGPRCILASGLSLEDRNAVRSILDEDGRDQGQGESTPLVVFTPEIAQKRVGDVLTDAPMIGLLQKQQEAGSASSADEATSPVILISGFTNPELRNFAARFRSETGVRAAFAKAVPKAMTKSVAILCGEIAQDHADALAGKLHGEKD